MFGLVLDGFEGCDMRREFRRKGKLKAASGGGQSPHRALVQGKGSHEAPGQGEASGGGQSPHRSLVQGKGSHEAPGQGEAILSSGSDMSPLHLIYKEIY